MIDKNDLELIDRFLKDELIGDELIQIENRLKNDPNFEEALSFSKDIGESMKIVQRTELKKKLQQIAFDYSKQFDEENSKSSLSISKPLIKPNWRSYLSVAASIVFMLITLGMGYYLGLKEESSEIASIKQELLLEKIESDSLRNEMEILEESRNQGSYGYIGPKAVDTTKSNFNNESQVESNLVNERNSKNNGKGISSLFLYFGCGFLILLFSMVLYFLQRNKPNK